MVLNNEKNAYSILGLHKGASADEIKQAYVQLVKKYDPERHTERFMTIQHAFDRLKEPALRAREDVRTFNYIRGEFFFGPNEKTEASDEQIEAGLTALEQKKASGEIPADQADAKLIAGYMMRSWKMVQKRLWADANEDWQRVLALDPTHRRAKNNLLFSLIQLGYSYANHELFDEAIEVWTQAAQMNPDSDEIVHNLALACELSGRHGESRRYWDELLDRWRVRLDREPENEYLKGLVIELLREHGERPVEEEAPEAEGEPPRGGAPGEPVTQPIKPRSARGVNELKEILKLNPEDFEARYRLAGIYMQEHNWASAIEELTTCRKKFPRNIEVMNLLGWALLNHGKVDDAFMVWRKAKMTDPKNHTITESLIKAHMTMGRTLRERGLFTACLVHFKALMKYLPNSDEVHYEIGRTFALKGDEMSAYQEYQTALKMNPKNRDARHAMSALKLRR
ncbi:tetratricopeptide repeat protein [bacterium]|nr:tetratricopeptide repeat protein [bacterium]